MVDLTDHRGTGQFGPAYRVMFENDAHAPGSVDRVLQECMVRLCGETVEFLYEGYTPTGVEYESGSRPELERYLRTAAADCGGDEEKVERVCAFCAAMGEGIDDDLDAMRVGGLEEEIIARGTDWCTDVARVAAALCQIAGIPARLIMLADTEKAYSGHVIIEARRRGVWGAADPTTNVAYRHADGRPATAWELMNDPCLVSRHYRGESTLYTTPGMFRAAAVTNYFIRDSHRYDYTVSGLNDYYRSILEISDRGWPGGLRWLHGEQRR